jgi:hypothetical protein
MAASYALNGETLLKAFTIILSDGSEMKSVYLFKVPHHLVDTSLESDVSRALTVEALVRAEREEWLPFVRFKLDVPITEQAPDSFDLPQEPFDTFKTRCGIEVFRLTDYKV